MSISPTSKLWNMSRQPASWLHGALAALLVSLALVWSQSAMRQHAEDLDREIARTAAPLAAAENGIETAVQFNRLKARDIRSLQALLANEARARKTYTEQRFAAAEEKRQLEKQWDLLTIYLLFDPNDSKLHIMRGDQALRTLPAGPLSCSSGTFKLDRIYTVSSKERFPHPERGRVDLQDGQLKWTPPQQAADRSTALGENVLFTNGPMIFHAPSKDKAQHDAYPHCCLGLAAAAASKIYGEVFVGSKLQSIQQKAPKAVDAGGNSAYN